MSLPTMHPVKSSNLHSIGFDESGLYVRFLKKGEPGDTYRYPTAPESLYKEMRKSESESVGSFFHANVRGKFEGVKMEKVDG